MIKSITVTNHLNESIKLELGRPEKSGFLVQSIDGLGPVQATINSTEMSSNDGSLFTTARVGPRNVVLNLKFLDKPTIEDSRQRSYKYFPIKKRISLLVETDNRVSEIYGYVESNEPDIFSKSSGSQISIFCPDPYFYSKETTSTIFSGIDPLFQFEFSNESLTSNLTEMGDIKIDTAKNLYYAGDADVGVIITIHAYDDASNITIYNTGTHETMYIDTDQLTILTGTAFSTGDDIIISTIKGDKYIRLLRDGVYTNIMNCLDKDSDWFTLAKGDNVFAYTAEVGSLNILFKIENKTVYSGV